jgi:hypothetical protein
LIYIVGAVVLIIPTAFLLGIAGSNSFVVAIGVLVVILGPVCYFMTVFSLFFPTVIMENCSFGYAFSKCFKLVKGRWWNTFGVVVVTLVIVYAVFLLITIPFSMLSGSVLTFIPYKVSIITVIFYTILISVFQIIQILPLTASAVTYFSYAEEKESVGLLERIEALGEAQNESTGTDETY